MSSTRKNVKMKQQLTLICFIVSSVFNTLISSYVRTIIVTILSRNKDLRISQNISALCDLSFYSILGLFTKKYDLLLKTFAEKIITLTVLTSVGEFVPSTAFLRLNKKRKC